jgi:hypothetical protein
MQHGKVSEHQASVGFQNIRIDETTLFSLHCMLTRKCAVCKKKYVHQSEFIIRAPFGLPIHDDCMRASEIKVKDLGLDDETKEHMRSMIPHIQRASHHHHSVWLRKCPYVLKDELTYEWYAENHIAQVETSQQRRKRETSEINKFDKQKMKSENKLLRDAKFKVNAQTRKAKKKEQEAMWKAFAVPQIQQNTQLPAKSISGFQKILPTRVGDILKNKFLSHPNCIGLHVDEIAVVAIEMIETICSNKRLESYPYIHCDVVDHISVQDGVSAKVRYNQTIMSIIESIETNEMKKEDKEPHTFRGYTSCADFSPNSGMPTGPGVWIGGVFVT